MSTLTTSSPATSRSRSRTFGRWMLSFLGFPLGGYASYLLIGPVDSLVPALLGGLLTGAVLGAVQGWALRAAPLRWAAATALGLMVGLGIGASIVGFATNLQALLVQGAVSGILVGAAQAVVVAPRLGRAAWAWPVVLGGAWAVGWAVTFAFGVQVEDQFTVFGSTGALVVTALTAVLPVILVTKENLS